MEKFEEAVVEIVEYGFEDIIAQSPGSDEPIETPGVPIGGYPRTNN